MKGVLRLLRLTIELVALTSDFGHGLALDQKQTIWCCLQAPFHFICCYGNVVMYSPHQ